MDQTPVHQPAPSAPAPKKGGKGLAYGAIGLIALAAGFKLLPSKDAAPAPSNEANAFTPSTGTYKDGTYESKGQYVSPAGPEEIDVTVTLKDNVITDAVVVSEATARNSVRFQGKFVDGFKPFVIGKNINEVHLTQVSGSSLTPKGFDDALEKIKAQAKV